MILVAQEGQLLGLVTVKDVLRHEAAVEHAHKNRKQQDLTPDWRDGIWNMEEHAAGLEVVLEEILIRFKAATAGTKDLLDRFLGKVGLNGRPAPDPHDRSMAEEYELEPERH